VHYRTFTSVSKYLRALADGAVRVCGAIECDLCAKRDIQSSEGRNKIRQVKAMLVVGLNTGNGNRAENTRSHGKARNASKEARVQACSSGRRPFAGYLL
jgi:hypothetical protein